MVNELELKLKYKECKEEFSTQLAIHNTLISLPCKTCNDEQRVFCKNREKFSEEMKAHNTY